MPKTKYLSTPEKQAIVTAKELDKSDRDVAKLFNVNQSTVCRVYNRYKKTNEYIESLNRAGHEKQQMITIDRLST